jgi:hypothetical protein
MRIGRRGLLDHLRLLGPLFALIGAVWALRMILAAAGAPDWLLAIVAVTSAAPVCVLLAAFLIHIRGFGSYPNVVVASLLLNFWGQLLVIAAILFSVVTGQENIYTAPEFSIPGDDPLHLRHIFGHLIVGTPIGTLVGAAAGCLVLWLLRIVMPARPRLKHG